MGPSNAMETPFAGDQPPEALDHSTANGDSLPSSASAPAVAAPPQHEDSAAAGSDHSEKTKKWGIGSILSRGRSASPSPEAEPVAAPAAAAPPPAKSGWFGSRKGKHSRPSSADPVGVASPAKPAADVPIVGGLPLLAGPAPNGTAPEGESPRRTTTESLSAPPSTLVTPDLEPLALPASAASTPGADGRGPSHRRHRSLLETLGFKHRASKSGASNSGDLDAGGDGSGHGSGGGGGGHRRTGSMDSAGTTDADPVASLELELSPALPAGTRGIANTGNSCFLNAALQCLRYTPGLPLVLVPDLLERAAAVAEAKAKAEAAGEEKKDEVAAVAEATSEGADTAAAPAAPAVAAPEAPVPESSESSSLPSHRIEHEDEEEGPEDEATSSAPEAAAGAAGAATAAEPPAAAAPAPESAPSDGDSTTKAGDVVSGEAAEQGAPPAPTPAPAAPAPKPSRPDRGELSSAVASLFTDLFLGDSSVGTTKAAPACASPAALLSTLRRFPVASEYFDGHQQDCQEVLQILLDLLHEDMNRVPPPEKKKEGDEGAAVAAAVEVTVAPSTAAAENGSSVPDNNAPEPVVIPVPGPTAAKESPPGLPPLPPGPALPAPVPEESAKADAAWASWRRTADSPVSDVFMGQLQSSVVCSKCAGRFTMYEPFWELSLPLAPKPGGAFSWFTLKGGGGGGLALQDCLRLFTADERLEGEEAFSCETCGEKTAATKHLRLHRLPDALVLHVKRFRHGGGAGGADKLTTDVAFPLRGLDLAEHLSPESSHPPEACCYDLYAVSYHTGTLAGGHYTAAARDAAGNWWQFNDEVVTPLAPGAVKTQHAYILFYARRKFKDAAAAAAAFAAKAAKGAPHGHRHSRSRSGGSTGAFLFGGGGKSKAAKEAAAE